MWGISISYFAAPFPSLLCPYSISASSSVWAPSRDYDSRSLFRSRQQQYVVESCSSLSDHSLLQWGHVVRSRPCATSPRNAALKIDEWKTAAGFFLVGQPYLLWNANGKKPFEVFICQLQVPHFCGNIALVKAEEQKISTLSAVQICPFEVNKAGSLSLPCFWCSRKKEGYRRHAELLLQTIFS